MKNLLYSVKSKRKIGLIQIDGKWTNLALAKLKEWHQQQGDDVTVIDLSSHTFDRIYASKIFAGGSGIDLKNELPPEVEAILPDYTAFKENGTISFTSRGCIRDCGFCIVREKEGYIREVPFNLNEKDKVILLDNNFLASPLWKEKLEYFIEKKIKVCFSQALDIRLINAENAELLSKVLYYNNTFKTRRIYFAFDNQALASVVTDKIALLTSKGIKPQHVMFYMLIGFNTTLDQDMERFNIINNLGCLPYPMIYNKSTNPTLHKFARWIIRRYYQFITWENYQKGRKSE